MDVKTSSVFSRHVPAHSQSGCKKLLKVKMDYTLCGQIQTYFCVFFFTLLKCSHICLLFFSWEKWGSISESGIFMGWIWVFLTFNNVFWLMIIDDWFFHFVLFIFNFLLIYFFLTFSGGKVSVCPASTMAWLSWHLASWLHRTRKDWSWPCQTWNLLFFVFFFSGKC